MTMAFNKTLKLAILETGIRQEVLCHRVEMTPWRLSRVIHGVAEPTPDEKRRLARALKSSVKALFPPAATELAS